MMESLQPHTLRRDFQQGIPCQNKSGEEMPAFAAMMITGETSGTYNTTKPTEDSAKQVLFGPPNAVPNNGLFFAVSPYDELVACTDTTTPGDEVGTVNGSWEMSTAQTGFVVLSGSGGATCRCRPFSGGANWNEWNIDQQFSTPEEDINNLPYASSWVTLSEVLFAPGDFVMYGVDSLDCFVRATYGGASYVSYSRYNNGFKVTVSSPGTIAKARFTTEVFSLNTYHSGIDFADSSDNIIGSAVMAELGASTSVGGTTVLGSFTLGTSTLPVYTISTP